MDSAEAEATKQRAQVQLTERCHASDALPTDMGSLESHPVGLSPQGNEQGAHQGCEDSAAHLAGCGGAEGLEHHICNPLARQHVAADNRRSHRRVEDAVLWDDDLDGCQAALPGPEASRQACGHSACHTITSSKKTGDCHRVQTRRSHVNGQGEGVESAPG